MPQCITKLQNYKITKLQNYCTNYYSLNNDLRVTFT